MKCQKLNDWFQERYDLSGIKAFAKEKLVPMHKHDIWYYTGGITMFLFILQFITGMALAFYYIPHSGYAYESVIDIVTKLNMGWFFKALHHWGAQLAIVMVFIHMFSTLLLKSYRKPREFLWITGFILVGISIFFGLSGYFMLWDERAFAAVRVATGGAGQLPLIGKYIQIFLRGGIDVTGDTLLRFSAFHMAILPIVTLLVMGLHILLVQFHGMSVPVSLENKPLKQEPFFPNVLYKDLMIWLVVLGVVVTLAALAPPEIGLKADPLAAPPENVKPEWYFLCVMQVLKLFPGDILGFNGEMIAITIISLGIAFLFFLPFIDRKSSRGEKSPLFTAIGIFYFLFFIIMTTIGFLY